MVYNHGKMKRDFTYIDDIIEGIHRIVPKAPVPAPSWDSGNPDPATSYAPYRIYNIGNNNPVGLMEFIQMLEAAIGKRAKINFLPLQAGDIESTCADVDDLMADVGFAPSTTPEEGITRFVAWYRNYFRL
jgi:UDP-glucuronate 4-epimerase